MKLYTKTGDKGTTALIGGKRVSKNHIRIEAYGTVDELIANIGFLRDQEISNLHKQFLWNVQCKLMVVSSILANDRDDLQDKLPKISKNHIDDIEKEIDKLDAKLPELKAFIIPGGHPIVSICHISRTISRRAERRVYTVSESCEVPEIVKVYLNRLSDYLFVLARVLSIELGVNDNIWDPGLEM